MHPPRLPSIVLTLQPLLLYLVNILGLAIGPQNRVLQLGITFPALLLVLSQSWFREWNGQWGIHYGIETAALCIAGSWFDWVVLKSPDREMWRRVGAKEEVPQGFWNRAYWGAKLVTGSRFVGWTCQVKNVPVEVDEGYSRWYVLDLSIFSPDVLIVRCRKFVARKSLRAASFFLLNDLFKSVTAASPYGTWKDIAHIKPAFSFAGAPFWTRFTYAWAHIVLAYTGLEMANAAYGVVSVAFGLAKPCECPSAFGDLKKLVSVREAWS